MTLTELLVTSAVVEQHISGQHHRQPSHAAFLHINVLVVVAVVTCKQDRCSVCSGSRSHTPHSPANRMKMLVSLELLGLQTTKPAYFGLWPELSISLSATVRLQSPHPVLPKSSPQQGPPGRKAVSAWPGGEGLPGAHLSGAPTSGETRLQTARVEDGKECRNRPHSAASRQPGQLSLWGEGREL